MTDSDLRQQLRELQAELHRVALGEEAAREPLRGLANEIERKLEATETRGEDEGLTERLRNSLAAFEAQHPDLAVLTARVIDQLVKLGI